MKFKHPLARNAKVWPAYILNEGVQDVLVVVTTLELDPECKRFKPDLVERLQGAIREFLSENPSHAAGFLLMKRPKA